ncbi:MAG: 2-C-methyl-D-erythritol 2,4-cyclodiphosphate synthase [Actinobacteria bacterium]|nr:2-C-methyl-D-erythritol 2,4-cyclodiphosphate synthase [Actinomycetota bacterium]
MRNDPCPLRVGVGFDAHRFVPDRPLVLGGLRLRGHDGLQGHSDADVLSHAVMDALLGAAGLEDIGSLFPETAPAFAGADSLELLTTVAGVLRDKGMEVVNVDAVIVCEEPRIAPHRGAMRARLASAIGIGVERINLRGTTTEGMGFTGRGEGIAAQAVALVAWPEAGKGTVS